MSDTQIIHLKTPSFPEFRFEWHVMKKIVYLIRATSPQNGTAIALDINTEGGAHNAVLIWLRGYREGKGELSHGNRTSKIAS